MDWKPSKPPPEQRVQLEQQPRSRWQSIKNQVVRATKVAAAPLITVLVISMIWLLWRDVIRVGGNSDYVLRAVITVVGIWILIRIGSLYEWTGFGERVLEKSETREIQPRRTLWDWMSLLLVPLMIAGIATWFTWWQNYSQQAQEERQRAQLAERQAQFTALQTYLDEMNHLMLAKHLLDSEEGETVFTLAQARTTTTIRQLDGEHNQAVTRFLHDSGLLREPPLLAKADLQDAKLHKAVLVEANLADTQLNRANLTDAVLINAVFSAEVKVDGGIRATTAELPKADLSRAALQGAKLSGCFLKEATLTEATLQSAVLRGADLQGADLSHATLQDAILSPARVPSPVPKTQIPAAVPGPVPRAVGGGKVLLTNLTDADLSHADLSGANLIRADLTDADLADGDLTDANLTDAKGWTREQLTAARSLEGATMPDGQILKGDYNPDGPTFEEWRKSRREENSGP